LCLAEDIAACLITKAEIRFAEQSSNRKSSLLKRRDETSGTRGNALLIKAGIKKVIKLLRIKYERLAGFKFH